MLCVDSAYQQTMDNLRVILGGEKFSVDTAEKVNGQMGQVAGEYLGNLPKPAADSESKLMVATGDCKGVPLVKESCESGGFRNRQEKPRQSADEHGGERLHG